MDEDSMKEKSVAVALESKIDVSNNFNYLWSRDMITTECKFYMYCKIYRCLGVGPWMKIV